MVSWSSEDGDKWSVNNWDTTYKTIMDLIFFFFFLLVLAAPHGMWDLSYSIRTEPLPLHWKCGVFTTGLLGKFHYGLNFECEGKIIFKDNS